jgi:hypothetical protein
MDGGAPVTELTTPLPHKVADVAGARIAAIAAFKQQNPDIPESEIRVELRAPGEIRVYDRRST